MCPYCRNALLKEEAERETKRREEAKREEELEQIYGHALRPIRKKHALIGGISGAAAVLILLLLLLFAQIAIGSLGSPDGVVEGEVIGALIGILVFAFLGMRIGWKSRIQEEELCSIQERELQKMFLGL